MTCNERVMIVDGLNLFIRHYIAHPAMSENGEQIGGFIGFFNNIARLVDKCKPDRVVVIWEGGGVTTPPNDNTPEASVFINCPAVPSAVGIVNSGVPEFLEILST